jgi:hypothetical protein
MVSEAKVMACYMMIGACWACASFAIQNASYCAHWITALFYLSVQAALIVTLYYYPKTPLVCFLAFLIGFTQIALYLQSMVFMQTFRQKVGPESTGIVFMLAGSLGASTCLTAMAVFESCYYTNRDVKYWVVINNTAVPALQLITALLFGFCLWRKWLKA